MLLRPKVEPALFAEAADFHIGALVGADRHIVERHIGNGRQRVAQLRVEVALDLLGPGQKRLQFADLGLQRLGPVGFAGGHRRADLLGGRVAARLPLLHLGDMGAARFVERDQGSRPR